MADSSLHANSHRTVSGAQEAATLGRFELRKVLGQGAQSTVWLAFDPRMEREVAIKVMRPGTGSDEKAIAQWLQEARSVGRVKHPNIVPVYEADIQDRQPYLVFEYVAGTALDQVLKKRGALPAAEDRAERSGDWRGDSTYNPCISLTSALRPSPWHTSQDSTAPSSMSSARVHITVPPFRFMCAIAGSLL